MSCAISSVGTKKKEKITYESEVTLLVWRPKRDGIHGEVFSKGRHRSGRQPAGT